ncbi:MAG: hypothetical protein ACYSVY_04240 [Planctomycetota bacterium]|jgi:hypothetical protein
MPRIVLFFVVPLLLLPVWASEPGEPLDCSDWVFLEPGLSCSVLIDKDLPLIELMESADERAED